MRLVYELSAGEGPEKKLIGDPFNILVTPGKEWDCTNLPFAKALCAAVHQVKALDPWPDDPPQTEAEVTEEDPSVEPSSSHI